MKRTLFSAITTLTFLVTFNYAQNLTTNSAADQPEEIITVDTRLVRMAFIAPVAPKAAYEVFDNDRAVADFQIVTPASEQKIDWVIYLDLRSKAMPEYGFKHLKNEIKRAAKTLSAPVVITNTQNLNVKKIRDAADIPDEWTVIGADGTNEAWKAAERLLGDSRNSRKALLWMTTEEPEMTRELLDAMPKSLTDKGIFTYISTLKPGKMKKFKEGGNGIIKGKRQQQIGYTNLSLNTVFAGKAGSDLIENHFGVFVDQCRQLNLIYYVGETSRGEGKIFGNLDEGIRVRVQSKSY